MSDKVIWLVFIEGCFIEGETRRDVYRVYADRKSAKICADKIEDNKHNKKFAGMWVDRAWVSDEYIFHEETAP